MEIQIGVGLGPIQFGHQEEQITGHLGSPESREYIEFEDALGDGTKILGYNDDGLVFNFDSDDDFRLSTVAIREPGHTLFGEDLFGEPKLKVLTHLAQHIQEEPVEEDHSDNEAPEYRLVEYAEHGLFLWFDQEILVEIEVGYRFKNDEPVWPQESGRR
ncbi:MAG: hypothetical protein MI742_03625 [Desulfobacterales bacterium]|nr:hypothetical protein [Desulfobacterales bacterium]